MRTSGASPEKPGFDCGDAVGSWHYLPPPYLGNVTVIFVPVGDGGQLYLSGEVSKTGKSDCAISIPDDSPWSWKPVDYDKDFFMALKPGDMGGSCISASLYNYSSGTCEDTGFIQIVGAGKAVLDQYDGTLGGHVCDSDCPSLTFHAVVMDLVDF